MQAPNNGNKPCGCKVVSKAKTIDVNKALEAPANIAAIPINAQVGRLISVKGKIFCTIIPNNTPNAPPIVNKGARVPPDVPLPKETDHDKNFNKHKPNTRLIASLPDSSFCTK